MKLILARSPDGLSVSDNISYHAMIDYKDDEKFVPNLTINRKEDILYEDGNGHYTSKNSVRFIANSKEDLKKYILKEISKYIDEFLK